MTAYRATAPWGISLVLQMDTGLGVGSNGYVYSQCLGIGSLNSPRLSIGQNPNGGTTVLILIFKRIRGTNKLLMQLLILAGNPALGVTQDVFSPFVSIYQINPTISA